MRIGRETGGLSPRLWVRGAGGWRWGQEPLTAADDACLDRLSVDGWQIVHVSEDRAGYLDGRGGYPEAETAEPGIGTARYLLSRPG